MSNSFVLIILQYLLNKIFYNEWILGKLYKRLFWSKQKMDDYQTRKLRSVLWEAVHYVPYYKNLNLNINFKEFSKEELNKFPIVDKTIIKNNLTDFISKRRFGIWNATSGSSGNPFKFKIGLTGLLKERLNYARSLKAVYPEFKIHEPMLVVRSYVPESGEKVCYHDIKNNLWFISPFHCNNDNLEFILDFMIRSKAKILRGYPSSILILTNLLKTKGIEPLKMKVISTSSEMLLESTRYQIEDYWRMKVTDYYGHNENVLSFFQCEKGSYHNNGDYGILEVQDGNIIGTSLNNLSMPFIRYNTLDKMDNTNSRMEDCSCATVFNSPLNKIMGRNDDILFKKDGTKISTANFSTAFKDLKSIEQFQFVQQKNRDIIVNIKLNNQIKELKNEEELLFLEKARLRLGEDASIQIRIVKNIRRDPVSKKIKTTIQKGA